MHAVDGTAARSAGVPRLKRRRVIAVTAAAAAASTASFGASFTAGAAEPIKIGVVVPLAGAFAASGQDELHGAQLAVAEINGAGGIKSLGGRRVELLVGDAGESPETAVITARRILSSRPAASIGCWYSSLTLAATQVAEQERVPWLTGSVADQIVGRGFKYVYQISAGSAASAQGLIDAIKKVSPANPRLALLMDNNTANVDIKSFLMKKITFPVVSDQTWTPPLADATPAVTAVMQARPTVIFVGATSTTDEALVLKQLAAQENKAPVIMGASSACNPIFLNAVGAKAMEGLLVVTGVSFPGKGADEIDRKYAETTKQAFMDCEALTAYVNVNIVAQALEKAGKSDAAAVQQALKTMDARNVPALELLPGGGRLRFGPNGRREGVVVELVQWQDGRPKVVYPPDVANAQLKRMM